MGVAAAHAVQNTPSSQWFSNVERVAAGGLLARHSECHFVFVLPARVRGVTKKSNSVTSVDVSASAYRIGTVDASIDAA